MLRGVPLLDLVPEIRSVALALLLAELSSQEIVSAVGNDDARVAVEVVDDFHIKVAGFGIVDGFLDAAEFER